VENLMDPITVVYSVFSSIFGLAQVYYMPNGYLPNGNNPDGYQLFILFATTNRLFVTCNIAAAADSVNFTTNYQSSAIQVTCLDDAYLLGCIAGDHILISPLAGQVASGTLGSLNATVQIAISADVQSVGVQVDAGTFIGTIITETSFDGGSNWNQTIFVFAGNTTLFSKSFSITYTSSPNYAQAGTIVVNGGSGLVRVRAFAYTSGSCNVTMRSSGIFDESIQLFTAGPGLPVPPELAITGGSVTTAPPAYSTGTVNTLSLTTAGQLRIDSAYPTATSTSIALDMINVGGQVTTAVPTYTTGTVNALSLNVSGGLRVDGSAVTQPVSGTVAISGTVPVSGTVATTQSTSPWADNITEIGGVAVAAVAKGTQASNAMGVQDFKDSGRVAFVAVASAVAGVTTEALLTLTPVRTVTAGTAATTLTVTSGKTLRIQAIYVNVKTTAAAVGSVVCHVRMAAGAVTATSQLFFSCGVSTLAATSGTNNGECFDIPDGFEISGTTQFGITQLASSASCTIDVTVLGFEY
jgi:hypothetical protein